MASNRPPAGIRQTVTVVVAVIAVIVVGGLVVGRLFDINLPFSKQTKDHSPALVLNEIRDLSEFHAAQAEFEVTVDREVDVKWVPSFIAGDRVQFVAVGTVDAVVDFGALGEDSVIIDNETDTATVLLLKPVAADPVVDLERSGVMNRDRGVLDRLGSVFVDSPTEEISLIREAEDKMAASVADTDLIARAEASTTSMLTGLIQSLDIENVRVVFTATSG